MYWMCRWRKKAKARLEVTVKLTTVTLPGIELIWLCSYKINIAMALEFIHSFYPAQILYRNLAEIDSVGVLLCPYVGWIDGFTTSAGQQLRLLQSPYLRMMHIVLKHNCISSLYYSNCKFCFCYLVCSFFYPSELMNQ